MRAELDDPPTGVVRGRLTAWETWADRWLTVVMLAMPVVSLGVVVALRLPVWAFVVLAAGGFILMMALGRVISRRGRREVEAGGWRLCLRCRYPTVEREGERLCPECGGRWIEEVLEKSWRWTYRD
jgi:hypothetical protein